MRCKSFASDVKILFPLKIVGRIILKDENHNHYMWVGVAVTPISEIWVAGQDIKLVDSSFI